MAESTNCTSCPLNEEQLRTAVRSYVEEFVLDFQQQIFKLYEVQLKINEALIAFDEQLQDFKTNYNSNITNLSSDLSNFKSKVEALDEKMSLIVELLCKITTAERERMVQFRKPWYKKFLCL